MDIPLKGACDMDHPEQEPSQRGSMPASGVVPLARAPWRRIVVGLAVLVLLPLLLARACTFPALRPPGAPFPTERLDHAPAASLRVSLSFNRALIPGQSTIVTEAIQTIQGSPVELTGGQTLAIDGVPLVSDQHSIPATIPRQPPGGPGYTVTYTDEQDHQTVVHIPAPQADFAVLEPAAGSQVPLPQLVGAGGRAVATPPPNLAAPYQPRPPAMAHTPLTVRYALPYPPHSVLQGPGPAYTPNQYIVRFWVFGPCAPLHACQPECELGIKDQTAPTGTATIDDHDKPWGDGVEACAPGPGEIRMSMRIAWNLPATAFWGFYVQFSDDANASFTWV